MASSKEPATFSCFSSLPVELRWRIWEESMPEMDCITLHAWQKGYWGPRNLPKTKRRRTRNSTGEEPIAFGYHHEKLHFVHVDMPLALVNREARSIAMTWVRKYGFRMLFSEAKECPVFVHRFDPMRDALFIGMDLWRPFCDEPHNRLAEPDLWGLVVNNTTDITRIAVPHTGIWRDNSGLAEIFHWYPCLRAIYVVWDLEVDIVRETMLANGDRNKARARLRYQRWKAEELRSRSLVWDREKKQFGWKGRGSVCIWSGSEMYAQMEEMGAELAPRLAEREDGEFEIRPIYAAKG
ncbi:hypothetical protein MKX07_008170 [Trichoderma sp. CBMAI-0711]|uniref:2EXR domain-containing protein n=1 Tax=Trichoderma parareesei TaxID=858221 RepID=A0A2H2ZMK5_TRIPA|nr:hypothetical protein MKX07_008170 [Trichoderma sp. CBMAI-0711]OTA04400.1 hypothetical protein A9Z42_0049830 [Trichoderma parareesei]